MENGIKFNYRLRTISFISLLVLFLIVWLGMISYSALKKEAYNNQLLDYNSKIESGYSINLDGRLTTAVVEGEYALKHYQIRVDDNNKVIYMQSKSGAVNLFEIETVPQIN